MTSCGGLTYHGNLFSSFSSAKITRCGHVYCWSCLLHYLSLVSGTGGEGLVGGCLGEEGLVHV